MWKKVEYSKKEINRAGKLIIDPTASQDNVILAMKVIDNWRAAHAFPMNTFAINLKKKTESIPSAIVVQRLKRLDTILYKLHRFPTMELYRMQDLGGCRVILPSIKDVYKLKKELKDSRIRHELHNEKDYIAEPNPETGYRGVHLIYRYVSDKKTDYNGLQVEIQIRTKLQHLWATAVETVGVFTQNGLKFNQGSERWLRFFKVTSALFSIEEKSAVVSGISSDKKEIISELLEIIDELGVFDKLITIGLATKNIGRISKSKTPGYYLLVLDLEKSQLKISKISTIEKATEEYNNFEQNKGKKAVDAVLVSAQSFDVLQRAYPNYFADITEFSSTLAKLLKKYSKQG